MLGVAGDSVTVGAGVDGLDVDLFGCAPDDLLGRIAVCRCERIDRVGGILSEQEYVALSWLFVSINAFNRITIAGKYPVPPRRGERASADPA